MKNKKPIVKLFIIFIIISVILTGCKNRAVQSIAIQDDKGQYLNIVLGSEPKTLDQSKSADIYSSQVILEINEALTRIEQDKNGKSVVKPAGALSWDISSDGLKWIFHLRDNEWSDGKKVTAKDYEYGIKRTLNPEIGSQYALLLYPIKGARIYNDTGKYKTNKLSSDIVGVRAIDDKTLEIMLESPCAYFLNLTSLVGMQPQRKDIIDKYGEKYGTESDMIVFCGPFRIKQWIHNNKIELIKNESYWDVKSVRLQRITIKFMESDGVMLKEFADKSVDIIKVANLEWKDRLNKISKIDTIAIPMLSTNYEVFNQNNKLFSNDKVRKAFALAADREEVSKKLWGGVYTPAYGWISPAINIGSDDFRQKSNLDPIEELKETAPNPKELLVEGLKELGLDKNPSKITVRYLQPGIDRSQKDIAEFFQQMYSKNLGINVKIEYVEWENLWKKIGSGDYQIASMIWTADYNDPMSELYLWLTGTNIIQTGWSNTKYDELIIKAASLGSDKNEERFNCFKEAEKILVLEDTVISPISYRNKYVYKHKYVKGLMFPLFGAEVELKYAYAQGRWE